MNRVDTPKDENGNYIDFYVTQLNQLENNFSFEEPVELNEPYRFRTEELQYLSENINKQKSTKYEKDVENIELFLAKNPYEEIERVAKKIVQLVKEKKRRYKDIAIITKNIQEYSSLVRAIFPKYQIPVFIDEKREVSQNIIIQYVLSILEMINIATIPNIPKSSF